MTSGQTSRDNGKKEAPEGNAPIGAGQRGARFLAIFLTDPTDVPTAGVNYVSRQSGIEDTSCLGWYLQRRRTRPEHGEEIQLV